VPLSDDEVWSSQGGLRAPHPIANNSLTGDVGYAKSWRTAQPSDLPAHAMQSREVYASCEFAYGPNTGLCCDNAVIRDAQTRLPKKYWHRVKLPLLNPWHLIRRNSFQARDTCNSILQVL
jgi:hypothetical protein